MGFEAENVGPPRASISTPLHPGSVERPMILRRSLLLILPLVLASPLARAVETPRPFVIPNSQVVPLHSQADGEDYNLYIALPRDYGKDPKHLYPVIYTLDADYSFA